MKFKEKLIPRYYFSDRGYDIPINQIVQLNDLAYEVDYSKYDEPFYFDGGEDNLRDYLLEIGRIKLIGHNRMRVKDEYVFVGGEEAWEEWMSKFWELYNNMDVKQLSRERKLKDLT